MDILLKIIVPLLGLTVAVITLTKYLIEARGSILLEFGRRKKLKGMWKGKIIEPNVPPYEFEMELKSGLKIVYGTGKLLGSTDYLIKLKGGFRDSKYLKMNYRHMDKTIIQFGAFILALSPNTESLSGEFIGMSPTDGKLISGKVEMEKQN